MPTRETAPVGAPCWIDLQTSDPDRARAFYTGLFGWEAGESSAEFGGYWMFTRDGVPVAGAMRSDAQAPVSDIWSVYLNVADAAKSLAGATEHGGQVVVPPMPVADLGTMGFLLDAGGAAIGVWQPDTFTGLTVLAEPGTPGWFEVVTRDHARTVDFYRDVFGWQTHVVADTPEFRYTILVDPAAPEGQGQLAGIWDGSGFLSDGVPASWTVYFSVADTDASVATVGELGGALLEDAVDTPNGRIAAVADPGGARFRIVGPNATA